MDILTVSKNSVMLHIGYSIYLLFFGHQDPPSTMDMKISPLDLLVLWFEETTWNIPSRLSRWDRKRDGGVQEDWGGQGSFPFAPHLAILGGSNLFDVNGDLGRLISLCEIPHTIVAL